METTASVDAAWFRARLLERNLDGRLLVERRIVSNKTLAKLNNGKPVSGAILRRLEALLAAHPVELPLVSEGLR